MENSGTGADHIKSKLMKFFTDKALPMAKAATVKDDDSFIESGILDSTGVLELLQYIEETFGFRVADDELVPDNLDSLNKLVVFIGQKTGSLTSKASLGTAS